MGGKQVNNIQIKIICCSWLEGEAKKAKIHQTGSVLLSVDLHALGTNREALTGMSLVLTQPTDH